MVVTAEDAAEGPTLEKTLAAPLLPALGVSFFAYRGGDSEMCADTLHLVGSCSVTPRSARQQIAMLHGPRIQLFMIRCIIYAVCSLVRVLESLSLALHTLFLECMLRMRSRESHGFKGAYHSYPRTTSVLDLASHV